jgi:acetyl esterase/lipase
MASDLASAVEFTRRQYRPRALLLGGHSLGATVAVLGARESGTPGLVLLAPVAQLSDHIADYRRNISTGPNENGLYEVGAHEMSMRFIEELPEIAPLDEIRRGLPSSMLVLMADGDESVPVAEAKMYVAAAREGGIECSDRLIEGCDHRFRSVQGRRIACETICQWIEEHF